MDAERAEVVARDEEADERATDAWSDIVPADAALETWVEAARRP